MDPCGLARGGPGIEPTNFSSRHGLTGPSMSNINLNVGSGPTKDYAKPPLPYQLGSNCAKAMGVRKVAIPLCQPK